MFGSAINVVMAVIAVSMLIVVHELGHMFAAKAVGMRVEAFAIGFWKKLFAFRIGETEYRLCLVPLGGYVKVSGENTEDGTAEPHEFWAKSPGQRAFFVLGGVIMNLVLAVALFILAFAIGVPFTAGQIGRTYAGEVAWEAGLKPGDRILAIDGLENPTFEDVIRGVALGSDDKVDLRVERGGRVLTFRLTPRYEEEAGVRMIGVSPPGEPVVTTLVDVEGKEGMGPASEAGLRLEDRILAVNGRPVATAFEVEMALLGFEPGDDVELAVERGEERLSVTLSMGGVPHRGIGISGVTNVIEALEGHGEAEQLGLEPGDRIVAVNGTPIASGYEFDSVAKRLLGELELTVVRDGSEQEFRLTLPDRAALSRFTRSFVLEVGPQMAWVREGGPAWKVGLRPGDVIVGVAGEKVSTWSDILRQGARAHDEERELQWERDGQLVTARVTPVEDEGEIIGFVGFRCNRAVTVDQRCGALAAVRKGVVNTWRSLAQIVLTLRGFATRDVSTKQMGGIMMIAYVSYQAASQGLGKLLYLTAVISGSLAFMNILPIPVLDGGHLLFIFLEKVRGRRLGERALIWSNAVGLALLLLLVMYVTWNDIMRMLPVR